MVCTVSRARLFEDSIPERDLDSSEKLQLAETKEQNARPSEPIAVGQVCWSESQTDNEVLTHGIQAQVSTGPRGENERSGLDPQPGNFHQQLGLEIGVYYRVCSLGLSRVPRS
jgi:hypothetical protein